MSCNGVEAREPLDVGGRGIIAPLVRHGIYLQRDFEVRFQQRGRQNSIEDVNRAGTNEHQQRTSLKESSPPSEPVAFRLRF